jgi:hypothetical protein
MYVAGRFTSLAKLMDAESILTVACAQIMFNILIRVESEPDFGGNALSTLHSLIQLLHISSRSASEALQIEFTELCL